MNTKRIIFWVGFIIVLALIVWGLIAAMNKEARLGEPLDGPAEITAEDHVRGPENAPVTIIEYSDFQCPACATYYPVVERALAEASSTIRFVYRHYPLYPMPHRNAFVASQAAEAAGLQGKFWDMYRTLFDTQSEWANAAAPLPLFEEYAREIGLDLTRYRIDVESPAIKARVEKDRTEASALGVNSTPTFFINGKSLVNNPNSYEAFKALIDEAARGPAN